MSAPTASEIERARLAFIDERVWVWFVDPPDFDPRGTLYFRILDELTRDVASRGMEDCGGSQAAIKEKFLDAESQFSWLQSLAAEGTGQPSGSEGWWNLWMHTMRDPREIKRSDFPFIDTSADSNVAHYVPRYLAQSARSRLLDRVYADILIASELFTLADRVYCKHVDDKTDARGQLEHAVDVLLCDGIMLLYDKLRSDGPVSAMEIAEGAAALVPCGVTWPTPLDDLLRDVMGRGGLL